MLEMHIGRRIYIYIYIGHWHWIYIYISDMDVRHIYIYRMSDIDIQRVIDIRHIGVILS